MITPPKFITKIPPNLLSLIARGEADICKQFIPDDRELVCYSQEMSDPIGDHRFSVLPHAIHRYPDRLLILLSNQCAGYCRFCFRKCQISSEIRDEIDFKEVEKIQNYIQTHCELKEIILSGGDPLLASHDILKSMLTIVEQTEHIRYVRIHTRLPITDPNAIDTKRMVILSQLKKPLWIVIHVNSVLELTENTKKCLQELHMMGAVLLSQSVLLKGINDTHTALYDLFSTLLSYRVKPYYIHYPDLVPGTAHFRVPLEVAIELLRSLRGSLSGIGIPDLVVDIPGGYGKITVSPEWAHQINETTWEFISPISHEKIIVQYPI